MSTTVLTTVIDNFKKAYPDDAFLVYKVVGDGWTASFHGYELLRFKLDDGQWLFIVKLFSSSGSYMNAEDIRTKAFPFVYDTKSETDVKKRLNTLRDQLTNVFPNHRVNVLVGSSWGRHSQNVKGAAHFQKEYGTDVDVVLS